MTDHNSFDRAIKLHPNQSDTMYCHDMIERLLTALLSNQLKQLKCVCLGKKKQKKNTVFRAISDIANVQSDTSLHILCIYKETYTSHDLTLSVPNFRRHLLSAFFLF